MSVGMQEIFDLVEEKINDVEADLRNRKLFIETEFINDDVHLIWTKIRTKNFKVFKIFCVRTRRPIRELPMKNRIKAVKNLDNLVLEIENNFENLKRELYDVSRD